MFFGRRSPSILAGCALLLVLAPISALSPAGLAQEATPGPVTPAQPLTDLSGVERLPLTGDRQTEFEAYITGVLATTRVPGAAVAVVQNGAVVY